MKRLFLLIMLISLVLGGCRKSSGAVEDESDIVTETNLALGNLIRAPEVDRTPQTSLSATQYDGTIAWFTRASGTRTVTVVDEETGDEEEIEEEYEEDVAFEGDMFGESATYIAKVELRAINGYTFDGISANAFKHSKAKSISNPANSGNVRITFVTIPLPTDLKTRFEITTDGVQGVSDLFDSLHAYLNDPASDLIADRKLYLGDYFDLPSLTVSAYPSAGLGYFTLTAADDEGRTNKRLRIIAVGFNTFMGKNGNSTEQQHIVFQFKNIPVSREMGSKFPGDTGYLSSYVRDYLIDGEDRTSFLEGLEAAGVKTEYLMEVKRKVISHIDIAPEDLIEITDKLWLPTEWEMFGTRRNSKDDFEDSSNQAVIGYYNVEDASIAKSNRIKYSAGSRNAHWYWLASTNDVGDSNPRFCNVSTLGNSDSNPASPASGGIVPAFVLE